MSLFIDGSFGHKNIAHHVNLLFGATTLRISKKRRVPTLHAIGKTHWNGVSGKSLAKILSGVYIQRRRRTNAIMTAPTR